MSQLIPPSHHGSGAEPVTGSVQARNWRRPRAEDRAIERFAASIGMTRPQVEELFGSDLKVHRLPSGVYETFLNEAGVRRLAAMAPCPERGAEFIRWLEAEVLPKSSNRTQASEVNSEN